MVDKRLAVVSGRANPELARGIAAKLGIELGKVNLETFANGEIYARYLESVRGSDLFIIQSVSGKVNESLMELLIMCDAAKRASARTVTAVVPHYGYSRQDKKSAPREPITAKLVANLITVAGVDRLLTMDLHQGQIQGFFDIPVNHLTALPIFAEHFKGQRIKNMCVVSPDVGRAKAAKKLADMMGADIAIMHKGRPAHNEAEITSLIGDVAGKHCIINDDMIDTAGSIVAATDTLAKCGAKSIRVCATHGIFSGPAYSRIEDSKIKEVVVCDTIRIPASRCKGKIRTLSVAEVFSHAISNIFNEESVSDRFDPDFPL
jgi:ribose-phosphate pyrophosphokinase